MKEPLKPGDKVMFLGALLGGEVSSDWLNWAKKAGLNLMQIYRVISVSSENNLLLEGKEYWQNAELFLKVEGEESK